MAEVIQTGGTVIIKTKDGESAYEIAVENGFIGTEAQWLASLGGVGKLIDGAAFLPRTSITPDGSVVRHWETYPASPTNPDDYPVFQVSQVGANRSLFALFQFGDDRKGLYLPLVKSRGDGIPFLPDGSPNPGYWKQLKPNDGIATIAPYGSQNANSSHAGYLGWISAELCSDNENAAICFSATSNKVTNGNGWVHNPYAQFMVPGPNRDAPKAAVQVGDAWQIIRYGANVHIGAGTSTPFGGPLLIEPGPLLAVPEPNVVEVDAAGTYYITNTAGVRRSIVTAAPVTFTTFFAGQTGGVITIVRGDQWVIVTLTMGANSYTTTAPGETIVRLNIAPILPGVPCLVANADSANSPVFPVYTSGATNRFTIGTDSGVTLQANSVYKFDLMWRVP